MTQRQLLVVAQGTVYGLDARYVGEITAMLPAARLPGAGPAVCGLVNLRGRMLAVLDLGLLLTGKEAKATHPELVVLTVEGRSLGLRVDEVREVVPVEEESAASELLTGQGPGGLIRAAGHFGDSVVLEVDVPAIAAQSLA